MQQTINKTPTLGLCAIWLLIIAQIALSQTTQFTYQGKLTDGGDPATGQYDLQFQIFAALSGGAALGTVQLEDVQVTNGVFSVKLDFGGANFNNNGAQFLEIGVRPGNQTGAYIMLTPRQQLTSTPYAIKSLNAGIADGLSVACVNCVTSSQIGSVLGSQVNGSIPVTSVPAGSGSYVQNTTAQQTSADFNISGTGQASIFNAATQYNLGAHRILSDGGDISTNLFAGDLAGNSNVFHQGFNNTFVGASAGRANTMGFSNSFFGAFSGGNNTGGIGNSFFGDSAGSANTTGGFNAFFGGAAGGLNTTGSNNTLLGFKANVGANNLINTTAIGYSALVSQSNSLVLGSINGVNGATADTNVGIGTSAPVGRLQVVTTNETNPSTITAWDSRHFVAGGTASSGGIGMSYDQTNNVGYFGALHPNVAWGNLILQSGGGNVGVGTGAIAPTYKLEINDPANKGLRVLTNSSGGTIASFGGLGDFVIDTVAIVGGRVTVKENGNVGIGTNSPNTKLQVAGGSVYITNPNSLVITSPNGTCWFVTVSNAGALSTIAVPCP